MDSMLTLEAIQLPSYWCAEVDFGRLLVELKDRHFFARYHVFGSAASVVAEVGKCEPSRLGFLCSSHGSVSPKVVAKVCGGYADLQALFTTSAAAHLKEREGATSLTHGSSRVAQGLVPGPHLKRTRQFSPVAGVRPVGRCL